MVENFLKHDGYSSLFAALEAEDIDTIKYYNEELVFWKRAQKTEKDKIKKFFYGENVNSCKQLIEGIHNDIIERRKLKAEFSRISG